MNETSVSSFWRKGFQTIQVVYKRLLYISFLGIILPHIFFELYASAQSIQVIENIKRYVEGSAQQQPDFVDLLSMGTPYLLGTLGLSLLMWMIYLSSYFAMVYVCDENQKARPTPSTGEAFIGGLKHFMPRGFIALLFFSFFFLLTQVMFPPLILFLLPGMMIPILICSGHSKALGSVIDAMWIRYGQRFPGGRFSLLLQTMSLGAFYYVAVFGVIYLATMIANLDSWLPLSSQFFISEMAGSTSIYFFSSFIKTTLVTLLSAALAAFSTSLFYFVKGLENSLPAEGVQA